ncbi:MAG TPA: LacI family transcriptional regulator [Hydrogenispora sp.]|mgnify:CR=1 FL=1|jgi:LacI family sucrose operon transcriptional repressor|nr:LacI family transcriptional regulator [Hydrogenispora sp.]
MPTIKDVAERAGVTVTTVSRVLNNRGYISEATRKKVYKAMEELDYQPNELARSLFRGKSHLLGLIIPTVAHPFFSELSAHIEGYAHAKGYKVLLCNSQLNREKEKEYVEMLKRHQVDGIIMASHTMEVDEFTGVNLPIVTFDRRIGGDIPYVSSDNYQGGKLATNLLIDKGCQKIAHVCGNLSLDMLANKRDEAFVATAQERGVEYYTIQTEIDVFETKQYELLIRDLFEEHPDLDGIFANSDLMAVSAIKVCSLLKKKIPDEVRIVGYDDTNIASLVLPQITTIRQPIEQMGALAIDLLIRQMNKEQVAVDNILPVTLQERATT